MSLTDDDQFAAYGGGNFDYLAMGPSGFGFVTMASGNDPNFRVGCSAGGNRYGVFGYAGPGRDDGNTVGPATNTYTNNAGVFGTSLQFTGVAGASDALQPGVYGQSGDVSGLPPGLTAGVFGASRLAPGVHGWSQTDHGVGGESDTSTGVWGASKRSYGVIGQTGGYPFGPRFTDPSNPVAGDQRSVPAGVWGTATAAFGVAGSSFKASGVLGQSGAAPAFDPKLNYTGGVTGTSRDAAGVVAVSQNSFGVVATSQAGAGVAAMSQKSAGVSAFSTANFGVLAVSGTDGPTLPAPFSGIPAAVLGTSRDNQGVIGVSQTHVGVLGFSLDSPGVQGVSANHVGVYGQATNNYAGYFAGNLLVTGTKSAAVPFPDGSRRVLYCMESPELWFEDFGAAKLKRGRAVVKIDTDFAKVVKLSDYHVFLTPQGDCHGLYVRRKSGKSFEVRELQGGGHSIGFSYRIVAKRKDIKNHKRFAKVDTKVASLASMSRRDRIARPSATAIRGLLPALAKRARSKR
jgi:hypothetical protein